MTSLGGLYARPQTSHHGQHEEFYDHLIWDQVLLAGETRFPMVPASCSS